MIRAIAWLAYVCGALLCWGNHPLLALGFSIPAFLLAYF